MRRPPGTDPAAARTGAGPTGASTVPAEEVARRRLEALIADLDAVRESRGAPPPGNREAGPPDEEPVPDDLPGEAPPAGVARAGGPSGGRHAHRPIPAAQRLQGWTGDRLPPALHDRSGLRMTVGAAHVGVVALVVAGGLALAAWWGLRAEGSRVTPVTPPVVTATGSPAAGDASPSAAPGNPLPGSEPVSEAQLVVDVVGAVRNPGIVVLPAGSRVVDAVEAAGGLRRGVRPSAVNMARLLTDGEQLAVGGPAPPAPGASPVPTGAPTAGSPAGLVDLNTADQATLETLPGVGPVTASAILQWRAEHGAFTSVDELLEISGIGEATLAEIAPHVTV